MGIEEFGDEPERIDERPVLSLDEAPVLTVDECAVLLRISRGSCYEAVRRGSIPSWRIGRRLLISRARLAALLNSGA